MPRLSSFSGFSGFSNWGASKRGFKGFITRSQRYNNARRLVFFLRKEVNENKMKTKDEQVCSVGALTLLALVVV